MEKIPVASSDDGLRSVLATLEDCHARLVGGASRETAQLVSLAILQLRMELNRVADAELKALCDAMIPAVEPAERSQPPGLPQGRRPLALRPGTLGMLKLVE